MKALTALAALVLLSTIVSFQERTAAFTVTNTGLTAWHIDGVDNPTLNLVRGQTYTFNVNALGHPFYIKTAQVTGAGSQYTNGVTNNGVETGTLTFAVPTDAPNPLFYQCGIHAAMTGKLNILAGAFSVVNNGLTAYRFDGGIVDNPTLNLMRGQMYTFNVNALGHPFYIKTVAITGTGSQYTNGVTNNGVDVGTVTWAVPTDAPTPLFYQCGVHAAMHGTINLSGIVGIPSGGARAGAWLGPARPNPARDGAQFRLGLPRAASVDLAVFDARGRRVQQLRRGTMPAGEQTIAWNGRDESGHLAPSGVYFFRLQVEGRMLTSRLALAR